MSKCLMLHMNRSIRCIPLYAVRLVRLHLSLDRNTVLVISSQRKTPTTIIDVTYTWRMVGDDRFAQVLKAHCVALKCMHWLSQSSIVDSCTRNSSFVAFIWAAAYWIAGEIYWHGACTQWGMNNSIKIRDTSLVMQLPWLMRHRERSLHA